MSCTGFAAGPGTQLKIAQAALKGKVKRFFPWQFGVDYDAIGRGSGQDLFDEQLDVRDLLRSREDGETEWVIVSTGVFLSFLFEDGFGVVEGAKKDLRNYDRRVVVRALGAWENGLTVTSVEDVAKLTAAILLDAEVANQVVHGAGDSISYERLAEIVGRVRQGDVEKQLWTQQHLVEELKNSPDDTMCKYRVAFAAGKGVQWDMSATYNNLKGIQTTDVERWLYDHLQRSDAHSCLS